MSVSPAATIAGSIEDRDVKIAEVCLTVRLAPDTEPARCNETAVMCVEHIHLVDGDRETVIGGFDLERVGFSDCEGHSVLGNLAALAIDDTEQAHSAGERIGLDDIKILRIGEPQDDPRGASVAA